MILIEDVVKHLIDKLAEAYPKPARWQAFATQVAEACGDWVTAADLEKLAKQIITTRDAKTFPNIPSLITLVKAIPRSVGDGGTGEQRGFCDPVTGRRVRKTEKGERIGGLMCYFGFGASAPADREKAHEEAEKRAISFLRGTDLAERSIQEGWATGLLNFAVTEGRAPGWDEEQEIVAQVRQNDIDVRDFVDVPDPVPARRNARQGQFKRAGAGIGHALRKFRAVMHETAARKLGGESSYEMPVDPMTEADRPPAAEPNDTMFERDCKRAGIDPARGVSPALLRTTGQL